MTRGWLLMSSVYFHALLFVVFKGHEHSLS